MVFNIHLVSNKIHLQIFYNPGCVRSDLYFLRPRKVGGDRHGFTVYHHREAHPLDQMNGSHASNPQIKDCSIRPPDRVILAPKSRSFARFFDDFLIINSDFRERNDFFPLCGSFQRQKKERSRRLPSKPGTPTQPTHAGRLLLYYSRPPAKNQPIWRKRKC